MDIMVDVEVLNDDVQVNCQLNSTSLSEVTIEFYKDDKLIESDTALKGKKWQSRLQLKKSDVKPGRYICQAMLTTTSFTLRTSFIPYGEF